MHSSVKLRVPKHYCSCIEQFRADEFLKSVARSASATDAIKPLQMTSVSRQTTSSSSAAARAASPIPPSSSSSVYRRRSSVSVSVPDRRRPVGVSRSLSSSLPQRTPPPAAPASLPPVRRHLAVAADADVNLHLSTNDVPSPATVQAIFDVSKLDLCRFVRNSDQPQPKYNKMLSYRREAALQGALVLAKNGGLELVDNIVRT